VNASLFMLPALAIRQQLGRQALERIPEPVGIAGSAESVAQYDRAIESRLAVTYAVALELVYRALPLTSGGEALDVACGPGHFTLGLASRLKFDRVTGMDICPFMVEAASRNARRANIASASFVQGDATHLYAMPDRKFDLVTCTMAAHHMSDLAAVSALLREMHRVVESSGIVFILDLARFKTATLNDRYVEIAAGDYRALGLGGLLAEFSASMRAAWTVAELRAAVPTTPGRAWWQIVPRGLPMVQVLLGAPMSRSRPFVRPPPRWCRDDQLVPPSMRCDWRLLRTAICCGARWRVG
jgi:ubiquinone/menaquinone biosynthesis C-methylase UbiE